MTGLGNYLLGGGCQLIMSNMARLPTRTRVVATIRQALIPHRPTHRQVVWFTRIGAFVAVVIPILVLVGSFGFVPANWTQPSAAMIEAIASTISAIAVVFGLLYAARQLRAAKQSAQGDFLLQIDKRLDIHQPVHRCLSPGGKWHCGKEKIKDDEMPLVDRYMGFFERIKIMIDNDFISLATFDRLYGYRLEHILRNKQIVEQKLVIRKHGWQDFIDLVNALEDHRKQTAGRPLALLNTDVRHRGLLRVGNREEDLWDRARSAGPVATTGERAERLEEELREPRKSWWRRMLGG
jgi:hypothetical protein